MNQNYYHFLSELKSLLEKHKLQLFPSVYDSIQVWEAESDNLTDDYFEMIYENKLK